MSVMRGCDIEGCPKQHRAKGLCATHYNQRLQPNRHAKTEMQCDGCDATIFREAGSKFLERFCTFECRTAYYRELDLYKKPILCKLPADHWALWYGRSTPIRFDNCLRCGNLFSCHAWSEKLYCSQVCQSRAHSAKREKVRVRTRKRSNVFATWREHIPALVVRDGLNCHLCDEVMDFALQYPDRMMVTVDHIIPRALGGTDDPANLKLAHWTCNVMRGAKPL